MAHRILLGGGVPLWKTSWCREGANAACGVGSALARAVAWEDLRWLREIWSGPIIVKGADGDDAETCGR